MKTIIKSKYSILFVLLSLFLVNTIVDAKTITTTTSTTYSSSLSMTQPRVALVLGGGGARGAAHLGVISVLEKAGIPVDLIVGTSIGSLVGAMYANDPHANDVAQILFNTKKNQLLNFSFFNLYRGPFSNVGIEDYVLQEVRVKQFNDLKIKFVAVATNLNTGETVPLYSGPIDSAVAASMALPPFFPSLKLNGKTLIDGGMSDPVPVDIAKEFHPQVIIAVSIAEAVPPLIDTPSAMENYKRAELIKRENYDKLSATGADVFIHPDVGDTGVFDNSHEYVLAQNGMIAAQQALPQICAILKAHHIQSNCS